MYDHDHDNDEFMKSLRADVPEDFARDLYARLMREEQQMFGKQYMTAVVSQNGKIDHTPILKPMSQRQPSGWVALVATFMALLMCSLMFALAPNSPGAFKPPATINTATAITAENVAGLQRIETLGRGSAFDVAWTPDGATIAVATSMGIVLHDADDLNAPTKRFDETSTYDILYSPDGLKLAGLTEDGLIFWDTKSGEVLHQIDNVQQLIRFNTDATQIAGVMTETETIGFWDVETGELLKTFDTRSPFVPQLSSDFQWLAYRGGLEGGGIILANLQTGVSTRMPVAAYASFALSDDGRWFVTYGGQNTSLFIYDLQQPREVTPFSRNMVNVSATQAISDLLFLPDSSTLIMIGQETIQIIDFTLARQAASLELGPGLSLGGYSRIAFNGSRFALLDFDGVLQILTTNDDPIAQYFGYSPMFSRISFSPDDSTVIASGSTDLYRAGLAKQWDLTTTPPDESLLFEETVSENLYHISDVIYTPDNQLVYTQTEHDSFRSLFHILDLETNEQLIEPRDLPRAATFSVSEDGQVLGVSNDAIYKWNIDAPLTLTPLEGAPPLNDYDRAQAAFSPDGRYLAGSVCMDGVSPNICLPSELRLWDVETGALLTTLSGGTAPITEIAFSADSQLVASTQCGQLVESEGYVPDCLEPNILMWDLSDLSDSSSLEPFAKLEGFEHSANVIAFSPSSTVNDALLLSAEDTTLKFWQISESEPTLMRSIETQSPTGSLAFNRAGTLLAVGGAGIIELWGTNE